MLWDLCPSAGVPVIWSSHPTDILWVLYDLPCLFVSWQIEELSLVGTLPAHQLKLPLLTYVFLIFYFSSVWTCTYTITRTSEWVSTLWRSCELFLSRDISWARRTSEISLPKTMNMISTDDHHELVLVFMLYYCWLDVDFNGLCI